MIPHPGTRRWLVCDMDDGILRGAATKAALVTWWRHMHDGPAAVTRSAAGVYEITSREPGREIIGQAWIMTAAVAGRHGFDPTQQPLYPLASDPYERVERDQPEAGQ